MTDLDLAVSLGREERPHLEFKSGVGDRDSIRKAIAALSNDLGQHGNGHLLIGVDKTGMTVEIDTSDQALLAIANIRNEGRILPIPVMTVDRGIFGGGPCIVVQVVPSPSPPVAFDGVAWVRPGPTTRKATPDDERVLAERRRAGDRAFDERPVLGATIRDLDIELFHSTYLPTAVAQEVLKENERNDEHHLEALRLFSRESGEPTALGLLVLGFDPTAYLRGAYIQFVRYQGLDQSAPISDSEELGGNLIGQLQTLERLLKANIATAVTETGGLIQREQPDYPLLALREVILNAVAHRNYESSNAPINVRWFEDRIEVLSPGGPFGSVTDSNYEQRNDYRNPSLAAALKHLGYVNQFGRGISLIRKLLEDNGNPLAEFEIDPHWWSVTLRRSS